MRGDLVEKTAADVCRELAAQGASGILAIDGPGGPGRVVFADGRIIAAVSPTPRARLGDRLVGADELDPDDLANALDAQQERGESLPLGSLLVERGLVRRDAVRVFVQEQVLDALFEIIRWRYGAFAFTPDQEARGHGVPLSLSVDDALVEVARRQREWDELSQIIPDLDSVPSFRTGDATANAALEPDEFAVLANVDGVRSVRALAADLGYGEFEAARIVYGLSLLGIVDVRPPQDEIGAALEDALGLGDFEPSTGAGTPEATTEDARAFEDDPTLDAPAAAAATTDAGPVTEPPDRTEEPAATTGTATPDEPAADEAAATAGTATPDEPAADGAAAAAAPDDTGAPDEPTPSEQEQHDEPTPVPPPPSHLHVVADPPEPPADAPEPQPTGSVDQPAASDDEPDVWVSAGLEDDERTRPVGETLDAELDLEADVEQASHTEATTEHAPPRPDESATQSERRPAADDRDDDADAAGDAETPVARRSGLGRGLAAIIPEISESASQRSDVPTASSDEDRQREEAPPEDGKEGAPSRDEDTAAWRDLFAGARDAEQDPTAPETAPPAPPSERPIAPTTGPEADEATPPARPSPAGSSGSSLPPPAPEPDPQTAQRGDDNDVSEFLRELSRLSVDGPSDAAASKPPVRPSSSSSDESKKKRRGLFGRG